MAVGNVGGGPHNNGSPVIPLERIRPQGINYHHGFEENPVFYTFNTQQYPTTVVLPVGC